MDKVARNYTKPERHVHSNGRSRGVQEAMDALESQAPAVGHTVIPQARVRGLAIPWLVLATTLVYALLRYVAFGDTSPAQIPLFITNKALAFSSVIFLVMAGWACVRRGKPASKRWGRWALHTACIHAVLSVTLLANAYYPAFFGDTLMSLGGEVSLLAAVLALYCFVTIGKRSEPMQRRLALVASTLAAVHVLFFGLPGWLDVPAWHGGFPPISLLAFLVAIGAAAVYWKAGLR